MSSEEALAAIRPKLAIALDVDDLIVARRLAASVTDYFGVAKVGLELFSAAGPEAIGVMQDLALQIGKRHHIIVDHTEQPDTGCREIAQHR